jgi:integrase
MARDLVARNVVFERWQRQPNAKRQQPKIQIGVDVPALDEIRAIVAALKPGRWRPLILTAIFTGLRSSEIRGLQWADIDFERRELHVRQRADCYNELGAPKSASSRRTVPLPLVVINSLREHRLRQRTDIVFTCWEKDRPMSLQTIAKWAWQPLQVRAGVVKLDGTAKYGGLHCLRHFYASWCINAVKDGGLGLSAKVVQERLGHSTIGITLNTYSHLFPAEDQSEQIEAAARLLLG